MFVDWICSTAQIMLINVVLSGDNAVVVALAASSLPSETRRRAMFWGVVVAIALRVVLTFAVSCILLLPGVRFLGAILLAYIGCKLVSEQEKQAGDKRQGSTRMGTAIGRIALADIVMSLDNVIAIAGVAPADPGWLLLGLTLSIAMMLALSTAILAVMSRLRWMAYLGTGVLALGTANMMVDDLDTASRFGATTSQHTSSMVPTVWSVRLALVIFCLTSKYWWPKRQSRAGAADPAGSGASRVPPGTRRICASKTAGITQGTLAASGSSSWSVCQRT